MPSIWRRPPVAIALSAIAGLAAAPRLVRLGAKPLWRTWLLSDDEDPPRGPFRRYRCL